MLRSPTRTAPSVSGEASTFGGRTGSSTSRVPSGAIADGFVESRRERGVVGHDLEGPRLVEELEDGPARLHAVEQMAPVLPDALAAEEEGEVADRVGVVFTEEGAETCEGEAPGLG